MKLVVFSICKDEAKTIGQVLDGIPDKIDGIDEIERIVISDGSSDNTVAIAKKHGADYVVDGSRQKRLAYRFSQAMHIALSRGADIAVGIDGDMQFNPQDIPKLVEPIIKGGYDFVSANRFANGKPKHMPIGKYLANRLGSLVVGRLARNKFSDVTCGFRAYSKDAMLSLNLSSRYTYTQESFQILAVKQMGITTVPIEVKYYAGRKSRVVTSFTHFLFGSGLNIMRAFRDFAPLRFFGILGLTPFVVGSGLGLFVAWHWISAGVITPYKGLGIIAIYLFSVGLLIWVLGLVADMLDRSLKNQEKIIEEQKKQKYSHRD